MMLKYSLHFLCLIYVANGSQDPEKDKDTFEIPQHVSPVKQPTIAVFQNHSGSLTVKMTGDTNLTKEYADSYQYRIFLKEPNGYFKVYKDVFSRSTQEIIKNLQPGTMYCFKMDYMIYSKYVKGINSSKEECAVVTENEDSRMKRITWVTVVTVAVGILLAFGCIWVALKYYPTLKRVLWPPLNLPYHIYKFFAEQEFNNTPFGGYSSDPNLEDDYDKISVEENF